MPLHCAHAQSRCWVVPVRSSPGSFVRGGGETAFPGRPSQSRSLMGAFTPSPSFSDFAGTQKRFVLGQSPKIASLCLPLAPLEQDPQLHLPSPQSALHTVGPKWTEFQTAWSSLPLGEPVFKPHPWRCHLQKTHGRLGPQFPHLRNGRNTLPAGLLCSFNHPLCSAPGGCRYPWLWLCPHPHFTWQRAQVWRLKQNPGLLFTLNPYPRCPTKLILIRDFFFFSCCICQYHKYLQREEKKLPQTLRQHKQP